MSRHQSSMETQNGVVDGGRGGGGDEQDRSRVLRKVGLVYAYFLYRFVGSRFVASIEIDAD